MTPNEQNNRIIDVTIIGGGPTGLAAAYYAGHRDASVRIIDTLPELGGQVQAVYPEKTIFDVAGHPRIKAGDLVKLQVEQALQFNPEVLLSEQCDTLEYIDDPDASPADSPDTGEGDAPGAGAGKLIRMTTGSGEVLLTRTLIITAGHGAFEPRRLGVAGIDDWLGRGLHYFVRDTSLFDGRNVVIVGGGDSALDWTLELSSRCESPLTLVHRRDRFRGIESTLSKVRELEAAGKVVVRTPCEVTDVHGSDHIEAVSITDHGSGQTTEVACDELVTLLGFKSALGPIANWGLTFAGRKSILVNPKMETNLPNVFAAGDVASYDGKITLITVGMAEAAIAANQAITRFRPEARLQPAYSTE